MPRLLLLLVIALISGCGQKGPLFLPPAPAQPAPPIAPAPEAATPAPAAAPGGTESEDRERAVPAAQP